LLGTALARLVEVVTDFNYYFHSTHGLRFLAVWDLQLNYLVFVFVPLLAFQFESFNIERNLQWKKSANMFVLFSALMVMLVEVAQIARGIDNAWLSTLIIYHVAQTVLLGVVTGIILFPRKLPRWLKSPQTLLVAMTLGLILINLVLHVLPV